MKPTILNNIGIIFQKELRSYFNSPVAYVVMVVFLAIIGYFHVSNLFLMNIASMRLTFEFAPLAFLVKGLIAFQRHSGRDNRSNGAVSELFGEWGPRDFP